ncbi:MAG: glycoside hydrolase family 2 TIM barrel-domain containing protein [Luteolibacter sp.]|jgi:hypothetical protein|nr:glycoside hydrolase family 2 TIM barrel-domain containing protein [Luteolibacter sp.]
MTFTFKQPILCIQPLVIIAASLLVGTVKAETPDIVGREAIPALVNPVTRSALRAILDLNGEWDFATDPKLVGESEGWFKQGKELPSARKIMVPGCWEAQGVGKPGMSHPDGNKLAYEPVNIKLRSAYTGAAWYQKRVTIPTDWQGKQIWLKVGGVNCQGWAWVNGTYITHNWAYCGTWKYNITDLVSPGREATITILARNDVPSRRGESNCERAYGGLSRGVELEATPAVLIDNALIEPRFDQKQARLHLTLRNTCPAAPLENQTVHIRVTSHTESRTAGEVTLTVPAGSPALTKLTADIALDPFLPWSPESPSLYQVEIVLKQAGVAIDGWIERFGIKKYEVRGGDMYLNDTRFFIRNCSENHIYPITICSPASREEHIRRLKVIKDYGFNYVRMHTHCENPEYFEAADEVGILMQPELPYYGAAKDSAGKPKPELNHMSRGPHTPKEDLKELVAHYRRYTSLAIYCGGNEAWMPERLGRELYQLSKSLDSSRPWLCLDGGSNVTRENSEMAHFGYGVEVTPLTENLWPHVRHEFPSLGIYEDPRIESKFTTGYAPNQSLSEVKKFVAESVGLDWSWAENCFDAGGALQTICHKLMIETTRIDPYLDGFSFWLMLDMAPSGQCGILDTFGGRKQSTPEIFQQFNAPTTICARTVGTKSPELLGFNPATLIHTEGEVMEVDWVISHFQSQALENATLQWQLIAGEQTLAGGNIEGVNVAPGAVPVAGRSQIAIPTVKNALKATLKVKLAGTTTHNSWDLWIYPKFQPIPDSGKGLAASPRAFDSLAARYPGVVKLDTPEAAGATLVVASSLREPGVPEALEQGKTVISLTLPGYDTLQPGTKLGVWYPDGVSNQAGTAIADHPAFGDFPHGRFLDQGWFRLIDTAEKLDAGHKFRDVEPLMVGIGRKGAYKYGTSGYPLGFNLYVFQARAGRGKLLASGLNLVSDNPEAVYLLDQFIRHTRSPGFQPGGTFDLAAWRQACQNLPSPATK